MAKVLYIVVLFILTAMLTSCGKPLVEREFNREGKPLIVVVDFHKQIDFEEQVWDYKQGLQGQALYSHNDNQCDIKIKADSPLSVDDKQTLTLGHELLHCLYGDYHK